MTLPSSISSQNTAQSSAVGTAGGATYNFSKKQDNTAVYIAIGIGALALLLSLRK